MRFFDRKNELDELTEKYVLAEVKRQATKIDLSLLSRKLTAFREASGQWQTCTPEFLALSLDDM